MIAFHVWAVILGYSKIKSVSFINIDVNVYVVVVWLSWQILHNEYIALGQCKVTVSYIVDLISKNYDYILKKCC